jgi:peptide/nickel transport system substrate-binding protein
MSTVSWAYPKDASGNNSRDNLHDYPAISFDREEAKKAILEYMQLAGVSAGDSALSIKFTIAGSNLTDHPTYQTFQSAADLLNECGWNIEVVPDTQALTKLSTGSLAVWAAAWGTTVDPDMYQVYHKNSSATSVKAWGYPEILKETDGEEYDILLNLSEVIDDARETEDRDERTELYREAMGYVLDMAIELPVYQRNELYAYNSNVIKSSSLPSAEEMNPYTSPLDKIWEIEFAD